MRKCAKGYAEGRRPKSCEVRGCMRIDVDKDENTEPRSTSIVAQNR